MLQLPSRLRVLKEAAASQTAYAKVDEGYLKQSTEKNDAAALFAGTCAVGCLVDLSTLSASCSNLGDSRCVVGMFEGEELKCHALSEDHAATDQMEAARVRADHPGDEEVLIDRYDDDDWRVKGICAFTRSIGDCQMKDKAAASLYNSYSASLKVTPRPGIKPDAETDDAARTKPYIVNDPEFRSLDGITDGFAIIACE